MTFLDTNVLIALLKEEEPHHDWAVKEFERCKREGGAVIADIVYCELSICMKTQYELDEVISAFAIDRYSTKNNALFRAGQAYKKYKSQNAGPKKGVLPDFIIGAIAEVEGLPLITANQRDFVAYFPTIRLIHP